MKVSSKDFQDMKALVGDGEISLAERREVFKTLKGRETPLDDEQLIAAIAATNDDDNELFANNVIAIELDGAQIEVKDWSKVETEPETPQSA